MDFTFGVRKGCDGDCTGRATEVTKPPLQSSSFVVYCPFVFENFVASFMKPAKTSNQQHFKEEIPTNFYIQIPSGLMLLIFYIY